MSGYAIDLADVRDTPGVELLLLEQPDASARDATTGDDALRALARKLDVERPADQLVDAAGRVVAPGFIDALPERAPGEAKCRFRVLRPDLADLRGAKQRAHALGGKRLRDRHQADIFS